MTSQPLNRAVRRGRPLAALVVAALGIGLAPLPFASSVIGLDEASATGRGGGPGLVAPPAPPPPPPPPPGDLAPPPGDGVSPPVDVPGFDGSLADNQCDWGAHRAEALRAEWCQPLPTGETASVQ